MKSVEPANRETARRRRRLDREVRAVAARREVQLALLNHQVRGAAGAQGHRPGVPRPDQPRRAAQPERAARRTGLHPATLTGILDRLERGRWIVRGGTPPTGARS